MKTIKLWYVDFWGGVDPETFPFTSILKKHFDIIIDSVNPDFVFCATSGRNFLRYSCPRILFTGEAMCPDFNLYDYAIGFDYISFQDRYLHYPLCLLKKDLLEKAMIKHQLDESVYLSKKKFCNSVISAGGGVGNIRDYFFDELSKYKQVDSGGRYRNNLPGGQPVPDKLEFQKGYKFSLALENTSFPGYTTEKIIDAWAAGTLPIYWGNPRIAEEFNPGSFINCNDFENPQELIEYIKKIDSDDSKYLELMKQPIITEKSLLYPMLDERYLEDFLVRIFSQDAQAAIRRNSSITMIGKFYEHRLATWNKIEASRPVNTLREIKRSIWGLKHIE